MSTPAELSSKRFSRSSTLLPPEMLSATSGKQAEAQGLRGGSDRALPSSTEVRHATATINHL